MMAAHIALTMQCHLLFCISSSSIECILTEWLFGEQNSKKKNKKNIMMSPIKPVTFNPLNYLKKEDSHCKDTESVVPTFMVRTMAFYDFRPLAYVRHTKTTLFWPNTNIKLPEKSIHRRGKDREHGRHFLQVEVTFVLLRIKKKKKKPVIISRWDIGLFVC